MLKLGINGFGRIGRAIAKINDQQNLFELVAINDINPHVDNLAYLFKYDSTYGRFPGEVSHDSDSISINGKKVAYLVNQHIEDADWSKHNVDVVIDASGITTNINGSKKLVEQDGTVKKVIITHSNPDVDNEIIMGVNESELSPSDKVISNSICDANAISHVLKWIDDEYQVLSGSVTTIHPWLSYQNLVDGASISQANPGVVWKDYALGRSSVDSLIPKNTTAMTATEKVLPNLKDKLMSFSYRIPTDIVASSDIIVQPQNMPAIEEFRSFIDKKIQESSYVRGNTESLVSLDYEQETVSAIIDLQWLKAHNNLLKIVVWYDNEWGYGARALDLAHYAISKA